MYAIKNEEEDHLFMERSQRIKNEASRHHDYLGINSKFIICEHLNSLQGLPLWAWIKASTQISTETA